MMIAFGFSFLGGLTSVVMVDTVGRKVTGVLSYGSYLIAPFSMIFATSSFSALIPSASCSTATRGMGHRIRD